MVGLVGFWGFTVIGWKIIRLNHTNPLEGDLDCQFEPKPFGAFGHCIFRDKHYVEKFQLSMSHSVNVMVNRRQITICMLSCPNSLSKFLCQLTGLQF